MWKAYNTSMMDTPIGVNACPACGATTAMAAARYCMACGSALAPSLTAPQSTKWYHNVWFILLMLFFVLGPFGLGLVWKNPRLSRSVKWTLTIVTLAYTMWLIDLTISATKAVLNRVEQFNQTLQF